MAILSKHAFWGGASRIDGQYNTPIRAFPDPIRAPVTPQSPSVLLNREGSSADPSDAPRFAETVLASSPGPSGLSTSYQSANSRHCWPFRPASRPRPAARRPCDAGRERPIRAAAAARRWCGSKLVNACGYRRADPGVRQAACMTTTPGEAGNDRGHLSRPPGSGAHGGVGTPRVGSLGRLQKGAQALQQRVNSFPTAAGLLPPQSDHAGYRGHVQHPDAEDPVIDQ